MCTSPKKKFYIMNPTTGELQPIIDPSTLATRIKRHKVAMPSPVLHVRNLPNHTLETDLLKLFEHHGSVRTIFLMPQKRQALVEFANIEVANKVVACSAKYPFRIRFKRIQVTYSISKRILGYANGENAASEPIENHVLLYSIYSTTHPITIDLIHRISRPYGKILRIVILRKTQVQALVEFSCVAEARLAKQNLNGADIYTGCCTLKVAYARSTKLTVLKNDNDSWDFENTVPTAWEGETASSTTSLDSLLGPYENGP